MYLASAHRVPAILCAVLTSALLAAAPAHSGPADRITVAADGTGQYRTVQAAIDAVPASSPPRSRSRSNRAPIGAIVNIPSSKPNCSPVRPGGAASEVVIVENHSAGTAKRTAVLRYVGQRHSHDHGRDFAATNLTISNDFDEAATRPSGHQAVALNLGPIAPRSRTSGCSATRTRSCSRTLPAPTSVTPTSQGTVDFIFGGGTRCSTTARSTKLPPAAGHRGEHTGATGVRLAYRPVAHPGAAATGTTQLGRPWRAAAQVSVRESTSASRSGRRSPGRTCPGTSWQDARFAEYSNSGPGRATGANRPQLTDSQAAGHTLESYLAGSDGWNPRFAGQRRHPAWSDTADGFAPLAGWLGTTTGGAGGATVTVDNQADLVRTPPRPSRTSSGSPPRSRSPRTGTEIRVASNKTIVGVGTTRPDRGRRLLPGTGVQQRHHPEPHHPRHPDGRRRPGRQGLRLRRHPDGHRRPHLDRPQHDHPDERRADRQPQGHHVTSPCRGTCCPTTTSRSASAGPPTSPRG